MPRYKQIIKKGDDANKPKAGNSVETKWTLIGFNDLKVSVLTSTHMASIILLTITKEDGVEVSSSFCVGEAGIIKGMRVPLMILETKELTGIKGLDVLIRGIGVGERSALKMSR